VGTGWVALHDSLDLPGAEEAVDASRGIRMKPAIATNTIETTPQRSLLDIPDRTRFSSVALRIASYRVGFWHAVALDGTMPSACASNKAVEA
jgi:hypothetical protein